MGKHIIPLLVVLLLIASSFVGMSNNSEMVAVDVEEPPVTTSSGPMDSPWPMKCHDNRHTGRSPYSTANTLGIEKWRFPFDGGLYSGPAIDSNGTIYCRGDFGDIPYYLAAIYPNGTLKWRFETDGAIISCPAIVEDGTIYIGSYDEKMYAINPDGTKKWSFYAGDSITSSPAIAEDGTIYFGTMGNRIFAVNPNGTEKWHYTTGYVITSDPAVGDDGTIYIGSHDTYFYALNPNGTLKWRFKTGDIIKGPPSIADDGTVYVGSYDDYLYALYPCNGSMKWRCKIGYGTEANPSIAGNGTIYVGGGKLYAINPDGTMKWEFYLGENDRSIQQSSPAISADGTIFVGICIGGLSGGEIIAIDPDGTEQWRKRIATDWVESSPCIGEDGTVYIGSSSSIDGAYSYGYLHAFGPIYSNDPPEEPSITGEIDGEPLRTYEYTFIAHDPDNNPIRLYVDWGDDTTTGWTREYASDEPIKIKHEWSESGDYTIRAKVKDMLDNESDWGTLNITMNARPVLQITKPEKGLYVFNLRIRRYRFRNPLIIGRIDVEVEASDEDSGMERVEFYLNDELQHNTSSVPYVWTWQRGQILNHMHEITVVAVDMTGKSSTSKITVWRFL